MRREKIVKPFFKSEDKAFYLLHGDTMKLLPNLNHKFDMVFADPPYFLSNDGLSIQSGKIVSVNKGNWDKSLGAEHVNQFNREWLTLIRENMKEDATIWISGTMHNIFSIGQLLTELNFRILNIVTWEKTNPPPNFSCRYFTHSTEQIIWARKNEKVPHYFNYDLMKQINGDKQMKDVWRLPAVAPWEKNCGKHRTQKPLSVLTRLILASTKADAWILDPFTGSSTTGIAANLANRRFLGIDQEKEFLELSKARKLEIEDRLRAATYRTKLKGFNNTKELELFLFNEPREKYITDIYLEKFPISKHTKENAKKNKRPINTIEQHAKKLDNNLLKLFDDVRNYIYNIDDAVKEVPNKSYIAYKNGQNFACLQVRKKKLLLYLKVNPNTQTPMPRQGRDVSKISHSCTGSFELTLESSKDFKETKHLIDESYNKVAGEN